MLPQSIRYELYAVIMDVGWRKHAQARLTNNTSQTYIAHLVLQFWSVFNARPAYLFKDIEI